MFDHHTICHEGFQNVTQNGTITGFSFLARLPYYRGLGLSMIEDLAVTVDDEPFDRAAVRLSLRGRSWSLDDLETVDNDRWDFGEKACITVAKPGGLAAGSHRVKLAQRLRISYLPFVPTTAYETDLTLDR